MYYFIDHHTDKEGRFLPDLPDGTGFLLIAEPKGTDLPPWAIYRCRFGPNTIPGAAALVPDDLQNLLLSGETYPPALALARDDMSECFWAETPSRKNFADVYAESIRRHLNAQKTAPYILAEAVVGETGYLSRGEFCWVLRYRPQNKTVAWVSGDYFVYRNPAGNFRLTAADLLRLAGQSS